MSINKKISVITVCLIFIFCFAACNVNINLEKNNGNVNSKNTKVVDEDKKTESDKKAVKLSCFNLAESLKEKRVSIDQLTATLNKFEVVSFDIFDTLILRKLNQPKDVFMLMEKKLDMDNFKNIRVKAEKECRSENLKKFNTRETNINEIYDKVAQYTKINKNTGINIELAFEKNICFANPYMKKVYDNLIRKGKKIYATSDMYIPKIEMKKLLENCGYNKFSDIIVSCDYGKNKHTGLLFNVLKEKEKEKNIVHIGDNYNADVRGAKIAKINGIYYKACRDLGDSYRISGKSLIFSAYNGIVNNSLHNGIKIHSEFWEYGYVYGGLLTLGYVNWIHEQSKIDGISKILFIEDFGNKLKKIYDKLYNDIPSDLIDRNSIASFKSNYFNVSEKIAIVDLGWNSNHKSFKSKNRNQFKNYLIGTLENSQNIIEKTYNSIYGFNSQKNISIFKKFEKDKDKLNYLNYFFNSIINDNNDEVFEGIYEFVNGFIENFAEYKFLLKISPIEAFAPINILIEKDVDWKNFLSQL